MTLFKGLKVGELFILGSGYELIKTEPTPESNAIFNNSTVTLVVADDEETMTVEEFNAMADSWKTPESMDVDFL